MEPSSLLPRQKRTRKHGRDKPAMDENDRRDIEESIRALMPWYLLRARLLIPNGAVEQTDVEQAAKATETALRGRYRRYEPLPWELSRIRFEMIALNRHANDTELTAFTDFLKTSQTFSIKDRLDAARTAFRHSHLSALREPLEVSCRESIERLRREGPEERAGWFVSLAKAVLPTSRADAAAYFDHAVEAVSKFGDEMVARWEAVVKVARRASIIRRASPETVYRFVQCGEVIGNNVAREKYWDRNDVFRVALHLDAPSAFAALSRWRDRGVGSFDDQLLALATETVASDLADSRVAWSLSGFEGCNASMEYIETCLKHAKNADRQRILDMAVYDLELSGASLENLRKLEQIAASMRLSSITIDHAIDRCEPAEEREKPAKRRSSGSQRTAGSKSTRRAINACCMKVDLHTVTGIQRAVEAYRSTEPPLDFELLWEEIAQRITPGRETDFLNAVIAADGVDKYDIQKVVAYIEDKWRGKAGVSRMWLGFLRAVGKRFALAFSNANSLSYFQSMANLNDAEATTIRDGLIEGIAESPELLGAESLFGFVGIAVDRMSADEALELLDYALGRFEQHIDEKHGDGPWSEQMKSASNARDGIVGLIWSALGSPYSATRWEAAHCVRRLVAHSCDREVATLLKWFEAGNVGAFGSPRFPFYTLHARLYLLIAFARAAADDPVFLKPHADFFSTAALTGPPHVMIQMTAAAIALAIERRFPSSFSPDVVARLRKIGIPSLPIRMINRYREQVESPWHVNNQVDLGLAVSLGYDFDHYWLRPLGNVFGLSEKDTVELAQDAAAHILSLPTATSHSDDPRKGQWERLSRFEGSYNTWYDHGSYPRVDNYSFYYSYHACMALAAKLLEAMPVVRHTGAGYDEDPWGDWLQRHLLTRSDGKWLADRRDPSPPPRPLWKSDTKGADWESSVGADDFTTVLRPHATRSGFLCVSGHWTECDNPRLVEVHVATALVDPSRSHSVAATLRKSDEMYWSLLPRFGEPESAVDDTDSGMEGWIQYLNGRGERLDYFDPYAREIHYPPREIGDTFASLLKLTPDAERREWRLAKASKPSVVCETWSDKRADERDEPFRVGERIVASLDLLKRLCRATQKELLFEVRIEHKTHRRYSSRSGDNQISVPPSRRIFLLSTDGVLREMQRRHRK